MTPKEKAIELIQKFRKHCIYWDSYNDVPLEENHAKKCALIAVNLLLDEIFFEDEPIFWQQVKEEIEKL